MMLRRLVRDVRPEDVSEDHPINDSHLQLDRQPLPSVLLSGDVNLADIKPLMSVKAWRRLQKAVRKQVAADQWFCACCLKDLGTSRSVECSSCLDWFHYACAAFKRKCKADWFCSVCAN